MNSDIQQAINAEKAFNNISHLLVTFHDNELDENSIKKLHRSVENVHILQPDFIPKTRYIVQLKDVSEANKVKDAILRSQFKKQYLTVNVLDNFAKNFKNIDPNKLHVENLPISVTDREIKQLFPLCAQYNFVKSNSRNTKSVLAQFNNVKDAISAYKITNRINYQSNILKVQFFRDKNKVNDEFNDAENTDSEDDVSKWEKIEDECLKNKEVSNTLYIRNFPRDTTGAEILNLFPECCEYKIFQEKRTTSALVRFTRNEDAVKTYTMSNNIFKSNILQMEFYYKNYKHLAKIKSGKRRQGNEHVEEKGEEHKENNSNVEKYISKINEKDINYKNIDPTVLHIENLPLATTNEDLSELFPEHQQYQIIPDEATNSSSAYICFNSPSEALSAYKNNKNKLYNNRVMSVKFKLKKMKLNPFALKRKTNEIENSSKRVKSDPNKINENDDLILVGEVPNNLKIISEDDIECKSEDEDYDDDIYGGVFLEVDETDNEDNISEDNDFQGIELDDDTVLPLDEDDFNLI